MVCHGILLSDSPVVPCAPQRRRSPLLGIEMFREATTSIFLSKSTENRHANLDYLDHLYGRIIIRPSIQTPAASSHPLFSKKKPECLPDGPPTGGFQRTSSLTTHRHCGENDPRPSHFPLKRDMVGIILATKYGRPCLQPTHFRTEDESHTQSRPLEY